MSTDNIYFHGEIRKIFTGYPPLTRSMVFGESAVMIFSYFSIKVYVVGFCLCWGLMTCQPLWVILCHLPEKGRREIEEIHCSRGDEREEQGRKENE